jgi:hypothetical protein
MKGLCIASKAQHSKTAWDNTPGFLKRHPLALKARFIAVQAYHVVESRFHLVCWGNEIPGAMPQAERDVAPLALHQE